MDVLEITSRGQILTCPHCQAWEEIGRDQQRTDFQVLELVSYEDNDETIHHCTDCDHKFRVSWKQ